MNRMEDEKPDDTGVPAVGPHISHSRIEQMTIVLTSPGEKTAQENDEWRISPTEWTELSHNFRYNHNRCVAGRQYIFHGEEINEITGVKPMVIKLLRHNDKNIRLARIWRKLNHPHIVTALHTDSCTLGSVSHIYLALELCDEMNLYEYVTSNKKEGKPFCHGESLTQSKQLAKALCHIHSKNIIHRNLKPQNVLMCRERKKLKITDFSMSIETNNASSGIFVEEGDIGTPGYRAPEVCNKHESTEASDVFSLGLIFYFMWSYGLHPFGDDSDEWNIRIKKSRIPNFDGLIINATEQALKLLQKMLEPSPEKRPTADQICRFKIFSADHKCGSVKKCLRNEASAQCSQLDGTARNPLDEKSDTAELNTSIRANKSSDNDSSPESQAFDVRMAPHYSSERHRRKNSSAALPLERPRSTADMSHYNYQFDGPRPQNLHSHSHEGICNRMVVVDKLLGGTRVFNPSAMNTWQPMQMIHPQLASQNFTAVTLSGYIYLLCDDQKFLRLKLSRFNATWEVLPSMKYNHGTHAPAVAAQGKIYVLGSASSDGHCPNPTPSVECFDQARNRWSLDAPSMPTTRCHHAVAVVKGHIYCVGGVDASSTLNSVTSFDCYKKSWHPMPSMANQRGCPSVVYHEGKVFVLGGYGSLSFTRETKLVSVEVFELCTSMWTNFISLLKPRASFTVLIVNKDMYAVGGDGKWKSGDTEGHEKNTMERYSFQTKRWSLIHVKKSVRIDSMSAVAAYLLD